MNIGCTQKLFKELKTEPVEKQSRASFINDWHANLIRIDRRKCVLLTNDSSLYTIVIPGLRKRDFENFAELVAHSLFKNFLAEGLDQKSLELILSEVKEIKYTKTSSRTVLGSMNDLAYHVRYWIEISGGLSSIDIYEVNRKLNRIPMGALQYSYSCEKLKNLLTI